MIHKKYRDFFIYVLRANADEFDNEYTSVIEQYGQSNETKLDFYRANFQSKINSLKKEDPLDSDRIQNGYRGFIKALQEDDIQVSDLIIEKSKFSISDLKANIPTRARSIYTPTYKPYNPNTKYGRRKSREQAQRNYKNGTDEYRKDIDNIKVVIWVIVIIIAVLIFFIKASLSK